ncbi:MAG: FAD-dependent oxidoreductase, partial [Alphaproteobacteria bacterium]|nr:FAD-dependent oxidoreductase [Alphaproteobacteria bacterium]
MAMYDVIVIGSGPGGYVAAIRAAQLGFKTAIIERDYLGGICLNWGCIPTKALLRSAQIKGLADNFSEFGLKLQGKIEPDIQAIVSRSRAVSAKLNAGVGFLMKKNKIDVIWGQAKLKKTGLGVEIEVQASNSAPVKALGEGVYRAKHVILATGARPRILPGTETLGEKIWTYFEALVPQTIPESLVIIGSGAIGIEFASFYNAMGSKVTVVERLANILTTEDEEISMLAKKQLEIQGIKILTNANIEKITNNEKNLSIAIDVNGVKQNLTCEKLISAIGVVPNIEGLGLEDIGIKTDNCIVTDEWSRTNIAGIYAIGDVAGAPMLA